MNREIQGAESRLQVEEAVGGETESMRVFAFGNTNRG